MGNEFYCIYTLFQLFQAYLPTGILSPLALNPFIIKTDPSNIRIPKYNHQLAH